MSRRKRLHEKLYGVRDAKGNVTITNMPKSKVTGTGKWLQNGSGVGQTVTLPSNR